MVIILLAQTVKPMQNNEVLDFIFLVTRFFG